MSMKFVMAVTAVVLSAPAMAVEVKHSVDIAAPMAATWKAVEGFCSLDQWHPAVATCQLRKNGSALERVITTKDGAVIEERRLSYSDTGRKLSYQILKSPLPVAGYVAKFSVQSAGGGHSKVEWAADFKAVGVPEAEAAKIIDGIFVSGLESLKAKLEAH